MKFCNFCENCVNDCDCAISIWSIYQCITCKKSHSIFDNCNHYSICELCDKYATATDIGCRCMHKGINYILTDLDMKKMYKQTDYVPILDDAIYQPIKRKKYTNFFLFIA